MPNRRAFTLIELLIVITIIAVLMALLVPAVNLLRKRARIVHTSNTMTQMEVAVAQYASANASAAIALRHAAGLGAQIRFASLPTVLQMVANGNKPAEFVRLWDPIDDTAFSRFDQTAAQRESLETELIPPAGGPPDVGWWRREWPLAWSETDWDLDPPGTVPPILPFPWGQPALRLDGKPVDAAVDPATLITPNRNPVYNRWVAVGDSPAGNRFVRWTSALKASQYKVEPYTGGEVGWVPGTTRIAAVDSPVSVTRSDGTTLQVAANQPYPFDLGLCSPLRTIEILQAVDLLPRGEDGRTAYRSDRRRDRPWNDAWGNPIVVSYAIWHPPRQGPLTVLKEHNRDWYLRRSREAYQGTSALYVSIGAAGPKLRAPLPNAAGEAEDRIMLRDLWMQVREVTRAGEWTEQAFSTPPWKNIRHREENGEMCFVSAPVELR